MKLISENREAKHNYFLENFTEAGIELVGCEVKSARAGKVNLKDSYVLIRNGEAFLVNAFFAKFDKASAFAEDERRTRKLLLNANEILKFERKIKEKGLTIVPTKAYFNDKGRVKIEIALAKGKHLFDKRADKRSADISRDAQRDIKNL